MIPSEAQAGLLTAIKRAELHDDPLAPVLVALGDALAAIDGFAARVESAAGFEPVAVAQIEQAAVAGAASAAKGAVTDAHGAITTLIQQVIDSKRAQLTEQDRAEFVQVTIAAANQVVFKRDRNRTRHVAAVFGVLALVSAAGAGFAGYAMRSDRCALLETWASTVSATTRR